MPSISTITNAAVLGDLLGLGRLVQPVLTFPSRVGALVARHPRRSLAASCGSDVSTAAVLGSSGVADGWTEQLADDAIAVSASFGDNGFEAHGEVRELERRFAEKKGTFRS